MQNANPMKTVYNLAGFPSRRAYLENLSEEMGIDLDKVLLAASMLGPNEDFDGLVTTLEDENW